MASGILVQPYVIRKIVRDSFEVETENGPVAPPVDIDDDALPLIQEGLRGVVRIPGGTAHALDSRRFSIAVMGKTGTTNEFRDALFVGSTYGPGGITVAVRLGFDDNRSLGSKNRRQGGAAGVQGNQAQSVRREAGRAGASVSCSNGTDHQPVPEPRPR
jgi:membrane peptidoglycan carboxypeptidase